MKTNADDKMSPIKIAGGAYLGTSWMRPEQRTAIRKSDADMNRNVCHPDLGGVARKGGHHPIIFMQRDPVPSWC